MTKESVNEQRPSTLYFNWISRLEYLKIFELFSFSLKHRAVNLAGMKKWRFVWHKTFTGMQWGDKFFGFLRGSEGMLSPPPKKNENILKMKYLMQSGCIIACPGMCNHDINHTLHN